MVYSSSTVQTRQEVLQQQAHEIGAPSSFAKVHKWIEVQNILDKKRMPLNIHRPADKFGADVSLFYPGFDTFVCKCESLPLEKEDTKFAVMFTAEMSEHYSNEESRRLKIKRLLGDYLIGESLRSVDNTDFSVVYCDGVALIGEIKNEVGRGGCDSYFELVAYYINAVKCNPNKMCPGPCFLMEIIGTHVAIYGAVYTNTACIDRLTPCLWLTLQPNNRPAMAQLARTLKALKVALGHLKHYYTNRPSAAGTQLEVEFPCFRKFKDETSQQQTESEIVYTANIKNHVFRAKTNTGKKVVVKFVEKYGSDAHRACAVNGFAPQLLSDKKVTSRYKMIVMEDLEDATNLECYIYPSPDDKKRLLKRCEEALTKLHKSGFCHGDFRSNNILVVNNGKDIQIIDFDWSGRTNEEIYPLFMNHVNLTWHPTASDGKVLKEEHDFYWLERF